MNEPSDEPKLLDVTVYSLEMLSPPQRQTPQPREGFQILTVLNPSVNYYRFLYNAIGENYRWLSRRKMSDVELESIIQHPQISIYVLHIDGSPAGYAEVDRRQDPDAELVQFGLMEEYHGRGLGTWFLEWVIDKVWSDTPNRFWLHTCSLDHPAALTMYQKAGFVLFLEEQLRREY